MNKQDLQASLTKKAMSQFESKFRNVLALLREPSSVADLWKRLGAVIELDPEMTGVLESRSGIIDQPNAYARGVAQDDFVKDLFVMACRAFHTLQLRGVVSFVIRLTSEAERELEDLEIAAGIVPPRPTLPLAKTVAEILDDRIKEDWVHLSTDKFKKKLYDPAYKAAFDRLMVSGEIHSGNSLGNYNADQVGH
jgi:hypothetical protein